MKQKTVPLQNLALLSRGQATELVSVSSGFSSAILLKNDHFVLNLKSLMGLLSRSFPAEGEALLTVSGEDEEKAFDKMLELIEGL